MKRIMILAVAALILFAVNTNAQALKIGIVDVETIVKEMPEAKQAEVVLKDLSQKYQDSLVKMQKDLEEKYQGYLKQKAMMPADQQRKTEEELQLQNTQVMQYQEKKFGQQGELVVKREELLQPIREVVKTAIDKVAKAENIQIVLDKNEQIILYSEAKFDITYRVLDQIKRGTK